jgi:hypothetical protein
MAEHTNVESILAEYVIRKRCASTAGTALSETTAIALDLSAMIAYVAPLFELICDAPALRGGPNATIIESLLADLKKRSEAHIRAMASLNDAR